MQKPTLHKTLAIGWCVHSNMCLSMCVFKSPPLCVDWWVPCSATWGMPAFLSLSLSLSQFIHLCFANRQFVDVSLDLICPVLLWKPPPPWLIAALSRGGRTASGSKEINFLFGIRSASPRSMLIVSATGRRSGTGPPPNKHSATGWKQDYELFSKG